VLGVEKDQEENITTEGESGLTAKRELVRNTKRHSKKSQENRVAVGIKHSMTIESPLEQKRTTTASPRQPARTML